jgi:hypothetical protein
MKMKLLIAIFLLGCVAIGCKRNSIVPQLAASTVTTGGETDRCRTKPKPDCYCLDVYKPVCGCDGLTYGNACYAFCAGVQVVSNGPCGGGGDEY